MVGLWAHLDLLETAAEKKPQTTDWCGDKLENVLRLQSAATET